MLDFGEAVRRFYGQYTVADGRSQRSAFWWVALYELIIYSVLIIMMLMADGGREFFQSILDLVDGGAGISNEFDIHLGLSGRFALFGAIIFGVVNFIPGIMLRIRRFHDLGRSGWFVLGFMIAGLLPMIGLIADIACLACFMVRGTVGPNRYGPDPLRDGPDVFS